VSHDTTKKGLFFDPSDWKGCVSYLESTPSHREDAARLVMDVVRKGMAEKSEPKPAPRFKPGDAVVTRNWQPAGHTRLPGYARGHRGRIHAIHGVYILPDAHAHGRGRCPEPLYSVGFESGELWGDAAEPKARVYIDLWESYLQPSEA
jgi:nitrile hydratase